MKLRALILFVVPVVLGTFVFPFAMWASTGFPDEGSHGLWMPVMMGLTFGLPIGIIVGLALALSSFLFPSKLARAEAHMRDELRRVSNQPVETTETAARPPRLT